MADGKGSRFSKVFNRIIRIRYWTDFDRCKTFAGYMMAVGKKILYLDRAEGEQETFEQAKKRLKLTEAMLQQQQKSLFRLSLFMSFWGIGLFIYACYELIMGRWLATFVSTIVMLLAFSLAFRYHFWFFQIKQKKLGCSLEDWFYKGLLKRKSE